MKASGICHALLEIILFPSRQRNMSIWSIFVFLTIRPGLWHRARSSRIGSPTRANMTRFCCSMLLTRRTFLTRKFRIQFSKCPGRESARLSFAAFPRTADSPVCAVGLQSYRNRCSPRPRTVGDYHCIRFGSGAGAPNPTAWLTRCNAAQRRCIHKKVASKCGCLSIITWATQNSSGTPLSLLV